MDSNNFFIVDFDISRMDSSLAVMVGINIVTGKQILFNNLNRESFTGKDLSFQRSQIIQHLQSLGQIALVLGIIDVKINYGLSFF